jgi:hypothetical protein
MRIRSLSRGRRRSLKASTITFARITLPWRSTIRKLMSPRAPSSNSPTVAVWAGSKEPGSFRWFLSYLVVYSVDSDVVRIRRVLHAAQDWPPRPVSSAVTQNRPMRVT